MSESTVRQRKPTKATTSAAPPVPEPPSTPDELPKKTKKTRRRTRIEEEDSYTPWLDVLRVLCFLFVVSCGLSYLVSNGESWLWGMKHKPNYLRPSWWKLQYYGPKLMTLEDLAPFDGSDPARPVYLAIDGDIFDVSAGRHIYGPGGSYHFFAGVDASRGFVTGCFSSDRNGDLRGLEDMFLPLDNPDIDNRYWTPAQLKKLKAEEQREARRRVRTAVEGWRDFFRKSSKYHFVGRLVREPGWEGELKPLCDKAQEARKFRQPPAQ